MFGLALAGLGMSMVGSLMQAASGIASAKQAAKVADYNARKAEANAAEVRQARAQQSGEERKQATHRRASMEARMAKGGTMMSGTNIVTMVEQAEADEYNILNRDRAAEVQAMGMEEEGDWMRYNAEAGVNASYINAGATLLSGAGSAMSAGAQYGLSVGGKNPAAGGTMLGSQIVAGPASYNAATVGSLDTPRMDNLSSFSMFGEL